MINKLQIKGLHSPNHLPESKMVYLIYDFIFGFTDTSYTKFYIPVVGYLGNN